MPRAVVELVGATKIRRDLAAISERLRAPGQVLETEMRVLEQAEQLVFDGLAPKYVKTDRLRTSLTSPDGRDTVRRVLGNAIEFGTKVWYARFQRTIGPPSGKPRGRKRVGPSKVLKLSAKLRREAAALVIARIAGRDA